MTSSTWFSMHDKNLLLHHGTSDLLALAQRRGAPLHKLLSGTRVFETDLTRPLGRICHQDWFQIIGNCQLQLKSPELPFLLGAAILHNPYISLCQALLAAANLTQALQLFYYYRHQLFPGMYLQLLDQPDALILSLKSAYPANQPQFNLWVVLSLLHTLVKQQCGKTEGFCVYFRDAAPQTTVHLFQHLGQAIIFNQPFDGVKIEKTLLRRPSTHHHAKQLQAARRSCTQLSRILPKRPSLAEFIYQQQRKALPQVFTADMLACHLGLSHSVFRRLLTQEAVNFTKVIDDVRQDRAQQLLQTKSCSNRELASLLGYSDEHNFRRAFKRWTGFIPSHFRRCLGLIS